MYIRRNQLPSTRPSFHSRFKNIILQIEKEQNLAPGEEAVSAAIHRHCIGSWATEYLVPIHAFSGVAWRGVARRGATRCGEAAAAAVPCRAHNPSLTNHPNSLKAEELVSMEGRREGGPAHPLLPLFQRVCVCALLQ